MTFNIEQIALCPKDPAAARRLLRDMGHTFINDHVTAEGTVFTIPARNEADLQFNYTALEKARELEILHYTKGENWMERSAPRVSHLGVHCTAHELKRWRKFFEFRGIKVAQEVKTKSHANPAIAGKRLYHYVIFDTYDILSVDLKFIVRKDVPYI
jgi:hypothetical protein